MKWTAENNARLRELRGAGKKVSEIAKLFHTSERSIKSHLSKMKIVKYNLRPPQTKESDIDYFDWEQYRRGGECLIL